MKLELESNQTLFIHLTLVPFLKSAGETKTKPEKSSIRLPEGTLKEVGEYSIDIELHPEVVQGIKVVIAAKEEI